MDKTLTLNGNRRRFLSFLAGAGMMTASVMTLRHFFLANYPSSIFEGAFCDVSAFFNCDSSAFSVISQVLGIPIGYFGLFAGALVALGALFPSEAFERTNKSIALANLLGVLALFSYSIIVLKSLCLLCSGYYLFSILSFLLFRRYGIDRDERGFFAKYARFSLKMVIVFGIVAAMGAYGVILFHNAKKDAQTGTAQTIVRQFYELPKVAWPSVISPFWTAKSTEKFEDAPIQVVEYVDFLCPDCLYLAQQMDKLKKEFAGKINVAFQYFPLENKCNKVVDKDRHPGACDLSFMSAQDPAKFLAIHDEIFANFRSAKTPEWRQALARKYGVEAALTDPKTQALVLSLINTGMEYERTSDKAAYGIRSTPTMIINNRMVIGTLPYGHLKAIFQALVDEKEGGRKYLENWVPVPKKTLQTVK
jgi:uncharacterized membrane protein/thiol-disulfide isomerase/thioredoxin